ncbi:DUF3617 domain-containing protein [Candidatus Aalborgicola defluviihabitans]|jgi:hypothetical protein|uniref:DUF3617 domain-containing protein n=1 Tax=Candidatus Aalborgicola defluviihabitans TaxID=3386187 RepID=UPI001D3E45FE|nr:DUF3617 domain-containing protein [Burkholderiales bacterium]MBK7315470.1 DUF3617 domain-containing protein [Burkholderiales bacterium]
MKLHTALACLLLVAGAGTASAQNMKPGLWEISTQMKGSGQMGDAMAQAQKQMENLPPDQRKMMQDMMAKQGVQLGNNSGGGMTIKVCMTQEMVDRNEVGRQEPGCTHTYSQRTGNTMQFSYVCTKPPSSGEGQITFASPEAYNMKMTSTTTVQGAPQKIEMQNNGRWLGGDCGTIKPLAMPKK